MTKLQVSWKILAIVFLLAFTFRLISIDQSLWLDEATTARAVSTNLFSEIVTKFSPHDFHPPLYYLTLKVWTAIVGVSEPALRFPSVVFSLLTGWVVYLIGKELKNKKTGLYAAIFFLFNPLIVYYSQEARMYMMVTFLLTSLLYYLLRCSNPKNKIKKKDMVLVNILMVLSMLTFYGSAFFILAFYIFTWRKKATFQQVSVYLPGFIIGLLLVEPLLTVQLLNAQETLKIVPNWASVLGKANLKNLLLIPVKFSMGRITFEPKPLYYTVAFFCVGFLFYVAARKARQYKFLSTLFVLSIFLGFLFSFFRPLLQYFRFIYLVPIFCLLLALGSQTKAQRVRILLGFFFFSCVYLFNPAFHREDWKGLRTSLTTVPKVYSVPTANDPILYYKHDIEIRDIRSITQGSEDSLIIVPYAAEIYGFDYVKSLKTKGYFRIQAMSFRGLQLEQWRKTY